MLRRKQLRESRRLPLAGRRSSARQVQGPHVRMDSIGWPGGPGYAASRSSARVVLLGGARPRPVPPSPAPGRPLWGRINMPNGLRSCLPVACSATHGDAQVPIAVQGGCGVNRRSGRL